MIITATQPGNFIVPGSYIDPIPATPITPTGPSTALIGYVGTGQWGFLNTPTPVSGGSAPVSAAIGSNTQLPFSMADAALNGTLPECQSHLFCRIDDGTSLAAVWALLDTANGTIGTFTAINNGTLANNSASVPIGGRIDEITPAGSTSPTYRVTIFFANAITEVFNSIVGYAAAGGGYNAPAFQANLSAAINSGTKARAPSAYWVYSPATSAVAPQLATFFPAAGGADGAANVTTADLIGQDLSGAATGMYALRTMLRGGQLLIAGLLDMTVAQTIATFCQEEACITALALGPAGTTGAEGAATMASDNVVSRFIYAAMGWTYVVDPTTFQEQLENPAHAILGVRASLNPWDSSLNKPTDGGKGGVIATEWSISQMPDETQLQGDNVTYLKKYGGQFVVFNDRASDGTPMSDTTMLNYLGVAIEAIGTKYLGKTQQAVMNNQQITNYLNDVKALLEPLTNPKNPAITAYSVDGNSNTVTTIEQGFLIGSTAVQTLSGIRYILNILQVGSAVTVAQPATGTLLAA